MNERKGTDNDVLQLMGGGLDGSSDIIIICCAGVVFSWFIVVTSGTLVVSGTASTSSGTKALCLLQVLCTLHGMR